ncbi:H-NS histone family protein [Roseovarius sp.]|uniref:H-NS histone family protein n=1 Tax=Roseovarius sp. TaxID=1486281 RepID=UPI0026202C84|nr:H-NS histone family protein [Roseovarius sp.]
MSLDELKGLKKDIDKAIDTYENRKKAEARKELEEHAKQLGFKLVELVSDKPMKTRKPVTAKYQHPENNTITWSGRGMKPKWVNEYIDNGGNLDDLLIK